MIESHLAAPAFGCVALFAAYPELCLVNVTRPVATHAVVRQLLPGDLGCVTRVTVEFFVLAGQRPVAVAGMIEGRGLPTVVVVARPALLAESERMGILAFVTANTTLRQFVMQIAAAMAILAVQVGMRTQQGETGFLGVIELLRLPACRRVTVGAFAAALPAMDIVRCMAGNAALRSVFITVAEVAADTRNFRVFVLERVVGLPVVEVHVPPTDGVVAGCAVTPECARMWLLLLMAVDA